jgi:hypothetical protein
MDRQQEKHSTNKQNFGCEKNIVMKVANFRAQSMHTNNVFTSRSTSKFVSHAIKKKEN